MLPSALVSLNNVFLDDCLLRHRVPAGAGDLGWGNAAVRPDPGLGLDGVRDRASGYRRNAFRVASAVAWKYSGSTKPNASSSEPVTRLRR